MNDAHHTSSGDGVNVATDLDLLSAMPHLVVDDGVVVAVGPDVARELDGDTAGLLRPLDEIGTRLDDVTFADLLAGSATLRVRLAGDLDDRPVRLRRLGEHGGRVWLEVRSLAAEFRLESLVRRGPHGHMVLTPDIQLQFSITSNELADVFPGDDPLNWIELMDPDDMQVLGKAIHQVGRDPNLRLVVRHRLNADRTYTIIDTVESAVHDPDLRGVLVRSRLEDSTAGDDDAPPATHAGITVSDHMPIGVVLASTSGKVLHRNAVAAELVGARAGMAVVPDEGAEPWMLAPIAPEPSARFQAVFASACAGQPGHCTIPSPFDGRRWLRIAASPAAASTVVITIEDMTELAEAERALRASNRLLQALDSHSEELVVVFDAIGRTRYTSSSVRRHLGGAPIDHSDDFIEFVHLADRSVVIDLQRRVRANPSSSGAVEFRVDTDDDPNGRWHHATMTNLLDDPDVQGLVLTLRDVHERHVMERELRFWATHDALTTLADRAALRTQLDALLEEAEVFDHRTALVFCDVDHFKTINDRHGHHVGDAVLTEIARRLRGSLRAIDVVGRFGGDEFVVVVPNVDDEAHARALAERIFGSITGPLVAEGIELEVSVSMGVAVTDDDCTTADALLQRADAAMYHSKRQGRGRLSAYSHTFRPDPGR